MKFSALFCLSLICVLGCNLGHPTKTDKSVSEADLIGTWSYKNELTVILKQGGLGAQPFEKGVYPITWHITDDNHIVLDSIRYKFGEKVKIEKFTFIISDDYRDHFYFFGGPVDFDNYEIWEKGE